MTGSSHPRFRLLVGWCCLMSAALLIMIVFLATKSSFNTQLNTNTTDQESRAADSVKPYIDQLTGSPPGQSFRNSIRLIRDQEWWICNPPCQNSSLSLQNNTVQITVSGLYYINAQVYFQKSAQTNNHSKQKKQPTVILIRNEGNGKQGKKLSEVIHYGAGSVSLIRMVHLMEGDGISLKIYPQSTPAILSPEDSHTYWEIVLLFKQ